MQHHLRLKSVLNFRDIGGAKLPGGKHIRKGLIFRSASPEKITRRDVRKLADLGVRTIIDLRAPMENNISKNIPDTVEIVSLPLDFEQETRKRILPFIRKKDSYKEIDEVINSLYLEILDASLPVFRKVAELLLDPNRTPILIHCRAGKDRTGVIIALIHLALDADNQTIIDDYMKSNESIIPYFKKRLMLRKILSLGLFPAENILRVMEVKQKNIEAVIDRVKDHYGGIEPYLNPPGVEKIHLKELRKILASDGLLA